MKKLFFALLGLAFISANAQTVDEVIQKYSENLGGLEAFNKIKTAKITANYTTQGMDLPMTIQIINGKAARTDVEAMGSAVIRSYKDGKAWTQNPFSGITNPTEVTGAEVSDYKSQSMLASALMDYKARGHLVELTGQADVEGVKTYKIKLTSKDDGKLTTYYISTKDYTLIKSESDREMQGQNVTIETSYSDLKDFNGAKFFMTRTQKINGEIFQTTTFTNIELNVAIDEKIFDMPK
jgi:outer membrane lipoprotein-sorting protein